MRLPIADVYELIEPVDPDNIRASKTQGEFFLNWVKGGYDEEQGAQLRQNNKIFVVSGPYQPEDQPAVTHQIRIRVLTR